MVGRRMAHERHKLVDFCVTLLGSQALCATETPQEQGHATWCGWASHLKLGRYGLDASVARAGSMLRSSGRVLSR